MGVRIYIYIFFFNLYINLRNLVASTALKKKFKLICSVSGRVVNNVKIMHVGRLLVLSL